MIIAILVGGFFAVKWTISLLFKNKAGTNGEPIQMTVGNLIQKDSNDNGIPDWEEYLWGLNPNKDGQKNKEYIQSKRQALIQSGDITPTDDSEAITDNESLSRQFFAAIISLQQTGSLDEESMKSISEAVGKNVEAIDLPDIYISDMLKIQKDSISTMDAYRDALGNLINDYADANIGSELTFMVQGLSDRDPQAMYATLTVAEAYQSFAREMIKIPVPKSLSQAHLSAANNYAKTGETIRDLAKILTDPIVGMKAILNYKKYSDALYSDLEKIENILQ